MNLWRWMLALLGVLAMGGMTAMPASAKQRPVTATQEVADEPSEGDEVLEEEDAEDAEDADEAEDEELEDEESERGPRKAVAGRVPAGIREQLVAARRALSAAEAAADRGRDRQVAAKVRQADKLLTGAHAAALKRAGKELPGGVAAVRAVTAAQHRAIVRGVELAVEADGRGYDAVIAALQGAAEDRDEAARFLAQTAGAEQAVAALADELADELDAFAELLDDEDTDEDVAEDLADVADTVVDTAEYLGLDAARDGGDEDDEDLED